MKAAQEIEILQDDNATALSLENCMNDDTINPFMNQGTEELKELSELSLDNIFGATDEYHN